MSLALAFILLSFAYVEKRTAKVALLKPDVGRTHIGYVYEAYMMYKELNPHPRFSLSEYSVKVNMENPDIEELVKKLRRSGYSFVIAPHVSTFTNRFARIAEKHNLVVFAPLSMFLEPRYNLIKVRPDFGDMAEVIARHIHKRNYEKVYVLSRGGSVLKRLLSGMRSDLEGSLERFGIEITDYDFRGLKRDGPIVMIALFPDDVSTDMALLSEPLREGQEVILFTSNFHDFERFYGGRLKGVEYISAEFYDKRKDFAGLYKEMFGREVLPPVAAAYDVFSIIDEVVRRGIERTPRGVRSIRVFHGIQGDIPLTVDPDLSDLLKIDRF